MIGAPVDWWVVPLPDPAEDEDSAPDAVAANRRARLDRAGAHAYVTEAYEVHQRAIYSFAFHTARDPDVAADVTQEAFLRLMTEAERRGPPDHAKAWLLRVAANLIMSRGRRISVAGRWVQRFGQGTDTVESPEAGLLRQEQRERVRSMLEVLPPDARICLMMAAEGFSGREIAVAIGRTELATRVLMSRSRNRLRAAASADDETAPSGEVTPG
jgi:RNA polymerase sigma-70 factor (ECF subfamily)